MSIIYLIVFVGIMEGMVDPAEVGNGEFLYTWALFAISDALWLDLLFGKRALSRSSSISITTSTKPKIIRCRDCKHRNENGLCYMISGCGTPAGTDDDFYCAFGKRKGGR